MAKKYNITVPKKYMSNGEEKTQWNTVGTLVKFEAKQGNDGNMLPEGYIIELSMFPNTTFKVFEQKSRDEIQNKPKQVQKVASTGIDYPEEEINPDDIPF